MLGMAVAAMTSAVGAQLPTYEFKSRGMWASVNAKSDASLGDYKDHNNKLLISWRMLPTDSWDTAFYLYYRSATSVDGTLTRATDTAVKDATCFQSALPTTARVYYLVPATYFEGSASKFVTNAEAKKALREAAEDSLEVGDRLITDKLPYVEIPLKTTEDVCQWTDYIKYQANDCSVGDLDGDGQMEVVVKRLLTVYNKNGEITGSAEAASDTDTRTQHIAIFDAYKIDGTFLWRIMSGPNIIAGNSINFAVADLDGDGCAEFVTKTGEGTVFGDGQSIGDTNGDGRIDYRSIWPAGHYTGDGPKGYGGPEFFSVCDGKTGKELARANFIARSPEDKSVEDWVANWQTYEQTWGSSITWKLANSLRLGVASFTGEDLQIFLGRGVYGRTVVEGWQFDRTPDTEKGLDCSLTRMWKFDTSEAGGNDKNKDGKPNSAYAGQGNHSFNVADLDGDGKDEVMYGSCAWDDDGTGLWSTGLGHGDANHVGRFLPDCEGLQMFHCLEGGTCQVALHDAKDGSIIWAKYGKDEGDMGRCMTADVDPTSPGYEFWMYGNELFDQNGNELYNKESQRKTESSANAGIWFDGSLNRQMINDNIINSYSQGRTFTIYRYDITFNNSTKSNPGWFGDMLGDWREEFIVPDNSRLNNVKIFSTWYPSNYKLPYLMSDHTYYMQCIHEQVGYNQPTNIGGYYLGYDMDFTKVPVLGGGEAPASNAIKEIASEPNRKTDGRFYDLSGRVVEHPTAGLYIRNGKKIIVR